jgi:V/A-type H+-transporting ATPase subunit F
VYGFAIGDHDMITGFRLVGVEGNEVATVEEARIALSKGLENVDVGIIIIGEEFSSGLRDEIEKLRLSRIIPLIVEVPSAQSALREIRISDLVSKSLGIKL